MQGFFLLLLLFVLIGAGLGYGHDETLKSTIQGAALGAGVLISLFVMGAVSIEEKKGK